MLGRIDSSQLRTLVLTSNLKHKHKYFFHQGGGGAGDIYFKVEIKQEL